MMSVINSIGNVCFTLFYILLVLMAVVVLYDYFRGPKALKTASEESEADVSAIEFNSADFALQIDFQNDTSKVLHDLGVIVCTINEISMRINELDNSDLHFALENLNEASAKVLEAAQSVVDLNYPVDEEELNK